MQPERLYELAREHAKNEALPCSIAACSERRYGGNSYCYAHAMQAHARRDAASRKMVATRRRNHPEWRRPADNDEYWRGRAGGAVAAAVKRGILPDLKFGEYACVDCGRPAAQYDHRDYSRPLEVEPVCRSCNCKRGTAKWPTAADYKFRKLQDTEAA